MLHDLKNFRLPPERWVAISQLLAGLDQSIIVGIFEQYLRNPIHSSCFRSCHIRHPNSIERKRTKDLEYTTYVIHDLRAKLLGNLVNSYAPLRFRTLKPDELRNQREHQGVDIRKFENFHGNTYFREWNGRRFPFLRFLDRKSSILVGTRRLLVLAFPSQPWFHYQLLLF